MSDVHDEQNVKSLGKILQRVQRGTAPATPLLGLCLKDSKMGLHAKTCTRKLAATWFTAAKRRGQPGGQWTRGTQSVGHRPTRRSAACAHGARTHAAANKLRRRPATRRKPDTSHTPRDGAYTERPGQADTAAPGSSRNHERLKLSVVMNGPVCGTFHGSPGQRVLSVPLAEWQAARPGPWGEGHCAPPGGWTRARLVPKGPGG